MDLKDYDNEVAAIFRFGLFPEVLNWVATETHKGVETCNVGPMLRNIQMSILGVLTPYLEVELDSRWPLQSSI